MSIAFAALDHQAAFSDVVGMTMDEKGAYLDGLLAGAMGASPEKFRDGPGRMGAIRGQDARGRYDASVAQRREAGKRSAISRKGKTGSAVPNGAPNAVRDSVPNVVPNDAPNGVPNGNQSSFGGPFERRPEQEKRREENNTPLTPQGDSLGKSDPSEATGSDGRAEEEIAVEAWNALGVFPRSLCWDERMSKSFRRLERMLPSGMPLLEAWRTALRGMAANSWAKENRMDIGHLLIPTNFRRYLEQGRSLPGPTARDTRIFRREEVSPETREQWRENRSQLLSALSPAIPSGGL